MCAYEKHKKKNKKKRQDVIFQFSSVQAKRMSIWPPCVGRERKKGGQICLFQEKEKSESDRIPSENIEKKKVNRFFLSMGKRRDILSLSLYLSLSSLRSSLPPSPFMNEVEYLLQLYSFLYNFVRIRFKIRFKIRTNYSSILLVGILFRGGAGEWGSQSVSSPP